MTITVDIDFSRAREHLEREAVRLVRDSAATAQETAQREARVRSGNMRRNIALVLTSSGADVEGRDPITIYHEFGTGKFAGDDDSEYPGLRKSTGSEAEELPWVYFDERTQQFYTTFGVRPKPMLRPGFRDGVAFFNREKKRRGLA